MTSSKKFGQFNNTSCKQSAKFVAEKLIGLQMKKTLTSF